MNWTKKVFRARTSVQRTQASDADDAGLNSSRPTTSVHADNPIRSVEDDALRRAPLARSFAKQVLALDAAEGLVVAVLGPWGSGKTSFVNLARTYLGEAGATVLDFNPWMFSGTEQLVDGSSANSLLS